MLDGEQRLAGWTVLSPQDSNVKISATFEEKVVLLTESALFVVSFNYSLDKVVGFTRVPLLSVTGLQRGESPLDLADTRRIHHLPAARVWPRRNRECRPRRPLHPTRRPLLYLLAPEPLSTQQYRRILRIQGPTPRVCRPWGLILRG